MKLFLYYAVITLKVETLATTPEVRVRIEQDVLTHVIWAPDKEMLVERFQKYIDDTYQGQAIMDQRTDIIEYSALTLFKQWLGYQQITLRHKLIPSWLRTRLFPRKTTSITDSSSNSSTPFSEPPPTLA